MENQFSRTEMLIGKDNLAILKNARVAIFGIGGVGGHTFEALVRAGGGTLDIFDSDVVDITNLNRQIIATHKTVGILKTDAAEARAKEINPLVKINKYNVFYSNENSDQFDFSQYDYIVDAIDSVSSKIELVIRAQAVETPIISSMGTGNKLNPQGFKVSDIFKTNVCPLARVMRYELRKRGVKKLKVVYSEEESVKSTLDDNGRPIPASISFVPATAGLIIASEVVKDLINMGNS